jgi:hypothetical protein
MKPLERRRSSEPSDKSSEVHRNVSVDPSERHADDQRQHVTSCTG